MRFDGSFRGTALAHLPGIRYHPTIKNRVVGDAASAGHRRAVVLGMAFVRSGRDRGGRFPRFWWVRGRDKDRCRKSNKRTFCPD